MSHSGRFEVASAFELRLRADVWPHGAVRLRMLVTLYVLQLREMFGFRHVPSPLHDLFYSEACREFKRSIMTRDNLTRSMNVRCFAKAEPKARELRLC